MTGKRSMGTKERKSPSAEEVASILLRIKAVTLRLNPPYTWVSGIRAPIYTDNRLLMSYVDERERVVFGFLKMIEDKKIHCDAIAATATAGISWGAWIADHLGVPLVFVRGSNKGHGKENAVEGKVEKGMHYVVIEDLISTGGSSVNTATQVRAQGGVVEHIVAIFTYELPSSKKNFRENGLALSALTNFTTLISIAIREKYLKKADEEAVLSWKMDPEGWSR